ncbi:endonuclease/exonuclease/phosphatase family protein [Nocardia sp. NPDC050697]|uniref:endonuclease/exonuclease/phosphatase family protein n=1 Tax=Nocardia sp. NPDC050697 TaxID=3155158 RepID=UPI0033EB8306
MISVASWNVLHRVHAENWYEEVAARWPDESARIAAVAERVAGLDAAVIALQEVSGDQLAALRDVAGARVVHVLRYPRVPRPKRIPTVLRDRDEYLVILADPGSVRVAGEAFTDDPGKGALVVGVGEFTAVATHVSGDVRGPGQLRDLARLAGTGPAVLLGDFNADRTTVAVELGPEFDVAELPPGLPTRPRRDGAEKSQFIDHIVTRGAVARGARVLDGGGLSDHNPVCGTVSAG